MAIGSRFHLLPPRHARLSIRTQREPGRDERHDAIALAGRDAGLQELVFRYPELVRDIHDVQHENALDPVVADDHVEIAEGRRMRRRRQRRRQQGENDRKSSSDHESENSNGSSA